MKNFLPLSLLVLLLISSSCQTSFQGNEEIKILNNYNDVSSLEELINLPEFKDKILFINLYSFHCAHSVNEFPYLKKLQKNIQEASKAKEYAFIHLSTPKWAFESNWRSNVEDYDLAGYHFLINEEFQDNLWSHFPEEQKGTPFFIEVTKEKEIQKIDPPSSLFMRASLNSFQLQTFEFVKANLDSILSKHPKNLDLLFKFDESSKQKISFFTYSKNNPVKPREVDVWKGLKVFAGKSFDSISRENSLSEYSFAIPLDAKTLDSIIPE